MTTKHHPTRLRALAAAKARRIRRRLALKPLEPIETFEVILGPLLFAAAFLVLCLVRFLP